MAADLAKEQKIFITVHDAIFVSKGKALCAVIDLVDIATFN